MKQSQWCQSTSNILL